MKTLTKTFKRQALNLAGSALLCAAAGSASAGIINWNVFDTTGAGDVSTVGTLVEGVNMGGTTSALDTTVNGVLFSSDSSLLGSNSNSDFLDGSSTGDAAYDALIGSLDYGDGTSFSLTLGGLTAGSIYQVQAWFTDLRDGKAGRNMILSDGNGNTASLNAAGAGGLGQFALGTFIADATTQELKLASPGFKNVHLNGFQVRDVPAPAPLLLMGIAVLGMGAAFRRRRS